jgi:hypothetical protein
MMPIPLQLFPPRFTLRTMFIGIAATGSMIALFSRIARPPEQAGFALLLGIILPTLWLGAWRQFALDRLLAQVMIVSLMDFLLVEQLAAGRTIFLWSVALSIFIPSVMWYATSQLEPGAEKDRYRRAIRSFLIGLALVALQVVTSFIIVSLVLR